MSELEKMKEKIKPVAKKYNLAYVWIFGSYAKKKQKKIVMLILLLEQKM